MAGINWTSNSINSFFRTSLNQNTSGMNGLYGLLGERKMIKSGGYHKLMDAYVTKLKAESKEETESKLKESKATKKEDDSKKAKTYDSTGNSKGNVSTDSIIDTLI